MKEEDKVLTALVADSEKKEDTITPRPRSRRRNLGRRLGAINYMSDTRTIAPLTLRIPQ